MFEVKGGAIRIMYLWIQEYVYAKYKVKVTAHVADINDTPHRGGIGENEVNFVV